MSVHGVPSETSPVGDWAKICICCGRPLDRTGTRLPELTFFADDRTVSRQGVTVRLTPAVFLLFEELVHAYPGGLTYAQLWDRAYGDRPEIDWPGHKVLEVHIWKLRKALAPLRIAIPSAFSAGTYRLGQVAPRAEQKPQKRGLFGGPPPH